MTWATSKHRRASTLAETIVAIGVLAVVVLFLIGLVTTNYSLQDKGEENVSAVHVAEAEMDRWKARPYQELLDLQATPAAPVDRISDGREYRCRLTVAPLAPPELNPDNRSLRLTVRLDWTEATVVGDDGTKNQRPASLVLESVVSPGAAL